MEQTASTLEIDQATPGGAPGEPGARTLNAAAAEWNVQKASQIYTGRMLWAACLFLAGGAVLASVDRVGPAVGAAALSCLLAAVVVQYLGRRRLREALILRATVKGAPAHAARADAEATLERITR